ncbi:hypothetical protein Pla22_03060 [Rubripirellula amarantea]|uniref:DUF1573 domain-containing protein n=1 Tax=Rubripirellula amarantea TaxID=2527999 RepID=A0A5C5WQF5_9BACT|nr:DUF1573 domain-containing protein [Rubripirellula amarantea]TWT52680.1 hypothetical protein Pla22_03060 [Rubripirellula amarantea]
MNPFTRNLVLMVTGFAGLFVVGVALSLSVGYKPYGVPDSRREEYENKIAEIKLKRELLSNPDATNAPLAVVRETTHDFGLLDPHTTMTHSFTISNEGTDPLAVEVLGTSCKCTTGKLTDGLLERGESTEITLEWNTGYEDESYEQNAVVKTSDPLNREITLTVKGTVRTKLAMPEAIGLPNSDPLKTVATSFIVHSQLYEDFTVSDVRSEGLKEFTWRAEPTSTNIAELGDANARAAWRVTIETVAYDYGKYGGSLEVDVEPAGGEEKITREVKVEGKVRVPIAFKSPMLHRTEGLNFGTVNSGKEHVYHVGVQVRGKQPEKLAVLDIEPKELTASIEPTSIEGKYRLTITVPADCPNVMFNRKDKHGYVHVGDPDNPEFMNWFPMYGGVAVLE